MPRGAIKLCGERRSSSREAAAATSKMATTNMLTMIMMMEMMKIIHTTMIILSCLASSTNLMGTDSCLSPQSTVRPAPYPARGSAVSPQSWCRGSPSPISMPQAAPFCQVARKEMTLAVSARGSFDAPSHSQSLSFSLSASASRLHLVGTVIWYWISKQVGSSVFMFDTFDVSFALSIFWL